jgi:hypothetical protein
MVCTAADFFSHCSGSPTPPPPPNRSNRWECRRAGKVHGFERAAGEQFSGLEIVTSAFRLNQIAAMTADERHPRGRVRFLAHEGFEQQDITMIRYLSTWNKVLKAKIT